MIVLSPVDVVIIDDDPIVSKVMSEALTSSGVPTLYALTAEQGIHHMQQRHPKLVVIDLLMKGMGGLEIVQFLEGQQVLFISGVDEEDLAEAVMQARNFDVGQVASMQKPLRLQEFVAVASSLVRTWRPKP